MLVLPIVRNSAQILFVWRNPETNMHKWAPIAEGIRQRLRYVEHAEWSIDIPPVPSDVFHHSVIHVEDTLRRILDGLDQVVHVGNRLWGITVNHSPSTQNVMVVLRTRLRGIGCRPLGPDAGVATIGDIVRYPDALVACTKVPGDAYVVPGVVVVFEMLCPTSGRTDRIVKLREYRAVPSIRHYVILEHASAGLLDLSRANLDEDWTATALTAEDTLRMPEIAAEVPVAAFYEGIDFPAVPDDDVPKPPG